MYQVVIYYSISTEHVYDTSHIQSYTTITTIQDAIMSTKRTKIILQLNVVIYPSGRMLIHIASEVRSRYTSERIEKFSFSVVAEINRDPMFSRVFFGFVVRNEYSRFPEISRYFVGSEYAQEVFHRTFFQEFFRFVRRSFSIIEIENDISLFVDLDNVFKFRVHDYVSSFNESGTELQFQSYVPLSKQIEMSAFGQIGRQVECV